MPKAAIQTTTFVLSDASLDRDSERILVEGIQLDNFKKNPVMLYKHRRDSWWGGQDSPHPIGTWKNIRVTNGQLLAEPDFNDTELAQEVKALVEHGTLSACSIGFKTIAQSDDPALMLPGQKWATITQCELLEASIVDIPSNPNAVVQKSFKGEKMNHQINGDESMSEEASKRIDSIITKSTTKNPIDTMDKNFAELLSKFNSLIETVKTALTPEKKDATTETTETDNAEVTKAMDE